MEAWVVWLIVAVALAVGEMFTLSFFLAPFAGGALAAAAAGGAGAGAVLEWAIFLVVSGVLLAALRPLARSQRRVPPALRTGTAALVGRTVTVVERIDHSSGSVRLEGDVWTARPFVDDDVFEPGTRVQVVEIKGATALVTD